MDDMKNETTELTALPSDPFREAAVRLGDAFREFAAALWDSIREAFATVGTLAQELADDLLTDLGDYEDELIRSVATPKQYHLYQHGRPRVRKKWKNQLIKKALRQRKRGETS